MTCPVIYGVAFGMRQQRGDRCRGRQGAALSATGVTVLGFLYWPVMSCPETPERGTALSWEGGGSSRQDWEGFFLSSQAEVLSRPRSESLGKVRLLPCVC